MNACIDVIDQQIQPKWFKVFETAFLIAPATEQVKKLMRSCSLCGVISLDQVIRITAEHVLKDWKDVKLPDGTFMPYSIDNAVKALTCNGNLLEFILSKSFGVSE